MNKLVLIDGNSLLFRAYFAMRPMVTSQGIHTQGVFAFINMLNKIIRDHEPDHIAVAFDMKAKTFRHQRYPEYKAGRQQTPIELLTEIPLMHRVLEAMNIAVFEMAGYEADDIIGTISAMASREGVSTLVISGDKDELQLIDENVNVLINRKGMSEFDVYDIGKMKERYGLTPVQFIDLKGLMGDTSDNIPGIAGIGEKKGISLLEKYGSLESVLEHAEEIPGKMGENVRAGADSARLSKWLATIDRNVPLSFEWKDIEYREPDTAALISVYTELEFSSFIRKLQEEQPDEVPLSDATADVTELFSSVEMTDLGSFISRVPKGSEVFMEIDTDASHTALPDASAAAFYCPDMSLACSAELTPMDSTVVLGNAVSAGWIISGCGLKKNIYTMLMLCGTAPEVSYDAAIAEYLLEPNRSGYPLSGMVLRHLGCASPQEASGYLSDAVNDDSSRIGTEGCLARAFYSAAVAEKQKRSLDDHGLHDLFTTCEMPLVATLAYMEKEGIKCDPQILASIGEELGAGIAVLEAAIYDEAGREFNINSPKKLASLLFEELGIPYPKARSKTGGYSTAADVLDKLRNDHEIVRNVLDYRKLAKLKSTYVDGLLPLIGTDGRVRPHFMQTVAATGRLSCTEPNLQNIPVRDDYGRLIRKAFITSSDDMIFTGSDYSQIELRILASLSGDVSLINDFRQGKDIHRATASRVFGIPEDKVTSLDRSRAKAVNFGVIYGMSGFGLSENLGISRAEGQRYINDYFASHSAVKAYLDSLVEEGEANRSVRTHYGRLRQIPEFSSRKFMERELAKRLAMNTPIQGTAADIIKLAMNSVRSELASRGLTSKLILQIHDELIVEGPLSEADEVRDVLDTCMRGAADLAVELTCDIHTGTTWYELK